MPLRRVLCALACCFLAGLPSRVSANPLDGVIYVTVHQPSEAISRLELTEDDTGRHWSRTAKGDNPVAIDGLPSSSYRLSVVFADRGTADLAFVVAPVEQISIAASNQTAPGSARIDIVDRSQRA